MKKHIEQIISDFERWKTMPVKMGFTAQDIKFLKVYQNGPVAAAIIQKLWEVMQNIDSAYSLDNFDEEKAADAIGQLKLLMAGQLELPKPPPEKKVKLLSEL